MYFHTSRGDAFPTVVLEAMTAGLIPLVSEWTGSKEFISAVDKNQVVALNEELISLKIIEFTKMALEKRMLLASKMREKSKKYTEEFALKHYQGTFDKVIEDFKLI